MGQNDLQIPSPLDYASPESRKKSPIPPEIKRKMKRFLLWALGLLAVWAFIVFSGQLFAPGREIVLKGWSIILWTLCVIVAFGLLVGFIVCLLICHRMLLSFFAFLGLVALTLLMLYAMFLSSIADPFVTMQGKYTDADGKTCYILRHDSVGGPHDVIAVDKKSLGFADTYQFMGPYLSVNPQPQ